MSNSTPHTPPKHRYVFPDQAAADAAGGVGDTFVVARSVEEAQEQARAAHGPDCVLVQDPDVLDTWFSSGLWPFSTLGWPNTQAADLQRFYPTQVWKSLGVLPLVVHGVLLLLMLLLSMAISVTHLRSFGVFALVSCFFVWCMLV